MANACRQRTPTHWCRPQALPTFHSVIQGVAVGNVDTPMVFVAVLLMALLSLGLFAALSLVEWLVMSRRFAYLATADES